MKKRKYNLQFYFTVEGETESLYLNHFAKLINKDENAKYTISIVAKKKRPLSFAKSINNIEPITVFHLNDFEGLNESFQKDFKNIFTEMSEAIKTRKIKKYHSGYSNLTFELWLIIHKITLNRSFNYKEKYLPYLNKAFDESFISMSEYKKEKNCRRLISKITINDIKKAVQQAENIMKRNKENYQRLKYCGYQYYQQNPSLLIHQPIKEIINKVY
ncbi:MAG: RloB domain-containing protein [Acholeplasmataceae bacterium]|nr:RloB domain-containing protein [Acholeplasmataceae bacterium]